MHYIKTIALQILLCDLKRHLKRFEMLNRILISTLVFCAISIANISYGNDFENEIAEFDRLYAGASGTLVLPQGGSDRRRLGGATARIGYYLSESLSIEADAAWLEDSAGLGIQGLWHCWGYERLDPFLTFGARGWIDGNIGPVAGIGSFYHLTDNWSLRFDAQATLGIDGECEMIYSLGAGVQYTF